MLKLFLTACFCLLLTVDAGHAQIPRERVDADGPIEAVFWAPKVILTNSVYNLARGDLNVTIMHSFGITSGGITTLFGMDDSANIRFGADYGITDRLSIGLGRSRFDKLYDGRFKLNVLRQTRDNGVPLELAIAGGTGVTTLENGFELDDRLNYFASVMLARQFSERIRLQVSPMVSHFNTVRAEQARQGQLLEEENTHFGVGLAGSFVLSPQIAILIEYVPVIGPRSDGTTNAVSVGFDIDTGGHVFQLFFTTSQWLTEQHVMARNTDNVFHGDFRIGFNVNRVFGL